MTNSESNYAARAMAPAEKDPAQQPYGARVASEVVWRDGRPVHPFNPLNDPAMCDQASHQGMGC